MPNEQPILFPNNTWTNCVFNQVVIDFQKSVGGEPRQRFPAVPWLLREFVCESVLLVTGSQTPFY
jgi:hypothetical protein